jgi:hypothetical protein
MVMRHSRPAREARQRREISALRVATPMLLALDALERQLDLPTFADVRVDAVEHYVEWMLCRSVPRILETLQIEELDALPAAAVQRVTLALVRDLFRHHAAWIQTAEGDAAAARRRIDALFDAAAAGCGVSLDRGETFELEDLCDDGWAVELCASVGVHDPAQVARLFVWHAAVTAGIGEGIRDWGDGEDAV